MKTALLSVASLLQRGGTRIMRLVHHANAGIRMSRLALGAVASVGSAMLLAAQASAADRPNIVFILTDDQHFALFDVMPNVQKLIVQEGASFTQAYFHNPLCCPSRAAMLSGRYTQNHGVVSNDGRPLAKIHSQTVATWLKAVDYRTIIVGKYLNIFDGIPPGWDIFEVTRGPGLIGHYYGPKLYLNGKATQYPETAYTTTVYTDRAITHIEQAVEDRVPFFLWLAYHAPHVPPRAEPKYEAALDSLQIPRLPSLNAAIKNGAAYNQLAAQSPNVISKLDSDYRAQARAALSIDDGVGRIFTTLENAGVLDNTYIIVTTDNGWNPGYHRLDRAKGHPYDEVLKMPIFVRGPSIARGSKIDALVINSDVGPSIAALARATVPSTIDARSFAGVLLGGAPSARQVEPLFYKKGTANKITPGYKGLRSKKYMYVEYDTGEKELFDMERDPHQLNNIYASTSKALKSSLASRTKALAACKGSVCRSLEDKGL